MKTLAVGALLLVLLIPSAFAGSQRTHAGKVLCVEAWRQQRNESATSSSETRASANAVSKKSRFRVA